MRKKAVGIVLVLLCYSAAVAGVFYFVGYKAAYDHIEASAPAPLPQAFYAAITDIHGDVLTVTGMEVNDINFRGQFECSLVEETTIMWRYTEIPAENLAVGDHISITFSGGILESCPAQIQNVEVIQLLDDEI